MKIEDLAIDFIRREQNLGILIEKPQVVACLMEAARHYSTYGQLQAIARATPVAPADYVPEAADAITKDTDINAVEYGVIRPLFLLYVERDSAKVIEASRGFGVESLGRDSASIQADITQYENEEMPRRSFDAEPFSVGME